MRVTVIATGFPEASQRSSLFSQSQRLVAKKDQDVPPVSPRTREEMRKTDMEKHDKSVKETKSEPAKAAAIEEEDDSWGGLPSFLRRK